MKYQQQALVLSNRRLAPDYFRIELRVPLISSEVQPGQFVHVRLPELQHRVLRRPFSVCDAEPGQERISIVYKIVGQGTTALAALTPESTVDLLGPLGTGFTLPDTGGQAVIVAGGYGCAAVYMLARRSTAPCTCLLGGRTGTDLLLVDDFRALGCSVQLATDDGSQGRKAVVTDLLETALDESPSPAMVYACGPNPMLRAVAKIVERRELDAEISLDHVMCCGVGACFACVVKRKADTPQGWQYVRTCLQGPVFKASQICWD